MSDLEDTFGPDFADHVQERVQERRAERERVDEKTMKGIADKAINEEAFKGGDPMFDYTSENGITHNVLLMQLADPRDGSVWKQARKLDSGAVSVPLDYLGEWVWSIFNDEEMAKKMEEGEWYIVIGNLGQWEPEDGPPRDQLSPVRGIMSLEEAKQLADDTLDDEGFGGAPSEETQEEQEPEPEPEPEEEKDDEEDAKGGLFSGSSDDDDDDEEEDEEDEEESPIDTTYGEVANIVEQLADEEPEVWEVHEDHSEYDVFINVVCDHLGLDADDERVKAAVSEMALDRVDEGPRTDDEDDETDGLF